MKTRIIALFLALLTLALCFGSCANTVSEDTTPNAATSALAGIDAESASPDTTPTTDEWGRPYVEPPTPENYKLEDGTVITVLLRANSENWTREFFSESENGDMLTDEIYKRNEKLQEDLNFTFDFILAATKEETTSLTIAEFESGGSSGIDIVSNYAYYSTGAALRDCYENLLAIETLDFSNPWWNHTYVDAATIKDQLYFVVGDLNLSVVDRSLAIYYNSRIANDYQLGNLYEVVLDGKWTIDTLIEYTRDTWVDVNQSGDMDLPDKYGIIAISGSEAFDGFLSAFGIDILAKTNEGGLDLIWDTETVSNAIDYQITLFNSNKGAFLHSNHTELCNKFTNGESLFWLHTIYASSSVNQSLRSMDDTYGLIPLPKYDLEQENYYTTAQDAYCIMSIMRTSPHLEAAGAVLEEWNYRSYCDILPVYCEVIMKSRYLKDVESGMIFDLILDSIKFDTGMVYGSELDSIATSTRSIVKSGTNSFVSTYKQKQKIYTRKINDLLEYFDERN